MGRFSPFRWPPLPLFLPKLDRTWKSLPAGSLKWSPWLALKSTPVGPDGGVSGLLFGTNLVKEVEMVLATLVMATVLATQSQVGQTLTNSSILELIDTGLSSDLIVTMIETYPSEFETDLAKILELKKAGVPDEVLQAMLKAVAVPKRYDPSSDDQLLIYVSDSDSWSMSGGFAGGWGSSGGLVGGVTRGGGSPQTAEIIKTLRERCPDLQATMDKEKADYFIILEHEGGKGLFRKDNKVVVFDSAGTSVFSNSTRSLGNSVKDACKAIRKLEKR